MFVELNEGKAVLTSQGEAIPLVQKIRKQDKTKNKKAFETWIRFLFFAYDKESIYRNYLPKEREKKVVEMHFPDKTVNYFKNIANLPALADEYVKMTYTFKELLYRRLLSDVEEMMDTLSKVELTKMSRIKVDKEVTFYSEKAKENITDKIKFDVRIKIDNIAEKIRAADMLEKLLKREEILKTKLKEEQMEAATKKVSQRRLYDN